MILDFRFSAISQIVNRYRKILELFIIRFKLSLSFLIVFLISISAIIINQIISTTFSISMTLYVISFVALLYCLNFIIRKIVKLEQNKKAGFVDYLDLGFSLIIYVLGWYDIQRRIRRVILRKEKNSVYV